MAKKPNETTPAPETETTPDVPVLADEQAKAVEDAEAAAESPPDLPTPGTTDDLDVVSTDEATSLNPNKVVSGTKPDGKGGQVLLDVVDPAVANAALLPTKTPVKPESPSDAPEETSAAPGDGQVLFECTADNKPFCEHGPMDKGARYVISQEEADILTKLNAGHVVGGASDSNARVDGSDAT